MEVGTAVGYSTLVMAETMKDIYKEEIHNAISEDDVINDYWHIDTIELDDARYEIADKNIKAMNMEGMITQYKGDAAEVLKKMVSEAEDVGGEIDIKKKYDFIFIDAAKLLYDDYLKYNNEKGDDDSSFRASNDDPSEVEFAKEDKTKNKEKGKGCCRLLVQKR